MAATSPPPDRTFCVCCLMPQPSVTVGYGHPPRVLRMLDRDAVEHRFARWGFPGKTKSSCREHAEPGMVRHCCPVTLDAPRAHTCNTIETQTPVPMLCQQRIAPCKLLVSR